MKIKSKLFTAAAVAALMVVPCQMAFASENSSVDSAAATPAEEGAIVTYGDTGDTWFSFPFAYNGATWGDDKGRAKQDYTSTYIWVTRKDMPTCKVYVDGGYGEYGPWQNMVSYWTGTSVGNSATVRNLGEFQIMNRVRENGRSWARLSGWAYDGGGTLEGYWSPDSWGEYTKIND